MNGILRAIVVGCGVIGLAACAGGPPRPASLDPGTESCAQCRMVVSNAASAAQLVSPGSHPLFFDDIGCLASYLSHHTHLPARSIAYVADHRSREWVPAASALYSRSIAFATPMGSNVIAHASAASQQADPSGRGGTPVTARELFMLDVPDGTR